jgi:death-on-curing protein
VARTFFYLTLGDVVALHADIMERTGFQPAHLRDENVLESALMSLQMAGHYEQRDLISQAARLAVRISQAQAFIDGNKRTAFLCCIVFLWQNGMEYSGDPIELARQLEKVATRDTSLDEATDQFEAWLRQNVGPRQV